LLFELQGIETTDGKELRDIAATTALLERSDATWRRAFDPGHLTASAFVVHPETAQVLLHHHRRLGRWLQLGGHIEPEESPAAAALREAHEESGLEALALLTGTIFDVDVHDIPAGKGEPEHQHFDLRYVVVAPSTEGHSMDPLESLDLAWFTLDDARAKMAAHESLRAIEKIRQILRGR
jgi:8-oxo-dGTP pyrophosphatase MutT (NUDIX family)